MYKYIFLLFATLAFQTHSYAMQEPLQRAQEVAHSASELANDLVQVSTYYGRFKTWLSANQTKILIATATVCAIVLFGVAAGTYYYGTKAAMAAGKLYAVAVGKFIYGTLMLLPNFISAGLHATTNSTGSIVRYAVENGLTGLVTGGFGLAGWKLGKEFARRAGIDPTTDPKAHIAVCIVGCLLGLLFPFLWIRYRTARLVEIGKSHSPNLKDNKPEPKPSEHAALYALVYVMVVLCVVGGGAGTVYAMQVSDQARIEAEASAAKKKEDTMASLEARLDRVKKHADDGEQNGSHSPRKQLPAIDENADEIVPNEEEASQLEEVTVPLDNQPEPSPLLEPEALRKRLFSIKTEYLISSVSEAVAERNAQEENEEKAAELPKGPAPSPTPEIVRSLYDPKTRIQYTAVSFLVACIEIGKLDYANWVIRKYRNEFQKAVQFPNSYYKLDDLGNGRFKPSLLGQALLGAASNGYTDLVGLLYADEEINRKVYRILDDQGYNAIQLAVMGGHEAIANQLTEQARRTIVADVLAKGTVLKEAQATLDQAKAILDEAKATHKEAKATFKEAPAILDEAKATLAQALKEAKATFKEAQAALNQAKVAYDQAKRPYDQAKRTYDVAKAAFDEAPATYKKAYNEAYDILDEAKATFKEAQAALNQAKVAYDQAKRTYDQAKRTYDVAKVAFDASLAKLK